jgi:hypothetical protein
MRLVGVHVDEGVYGGDGADAEEARAAAAAAWAGAGVPGVVVVGLERSPSDAPRVAALLAASGPRGRARLVRALVRAALVREAAKAAAAVSGDEEGGRAVVALGTTVTTAAARVVAAAAAGTGLELAAEAAAFDAGPPGLRIPLVCPALGVSAKDAALHCRLAGLALPALPPPPPPPPTTSAGPSRASTAEAAIAFDFVDRAVGRSRTSAASMVGAAARFGAPGTGADAGAAAAAGERAPCTLCAAPLEEVDVGKGPSACCFACRETVLGDGGDAPAVWAAAPDGGVWGVDWLE